MKSLLWFLIGIVGGFAAAHVINKNPTGHELLAEVDARIGEFTDRIGEAYRGQEAKLDEFVSGAKDAASGAVSAVVDAASSTKAEASDAVSDAAETASDTVTDAAESAKD
ncbi:ATPase [Microbacterium sp.]|jgi:hypothetical protein|uniref:ATPase n=1 Tax=Microbacterium sp. TaxID=51671 RepID=UPI0037CA609B